MGQNGHALMYGVETSVNLWGGDDGIVSRYENIVGWEHVPRSPARSETPTIGYAVAEGGSGSDYDDVPYLEPCALADIETTYAESIARAKEKWNAFAVFCEKGGVILPPARLYLTITETA